jgi:hypothetical protein
MKPSSALVFAVLAITGSSAFAADPAALLPIPEADYRAARIDAGVRYEIAIAACRLQSWSVRSDCEDAALGDLRRAELDARNAYLRSQSELATLVNYGRK